MMVAETSLKIMLNPFIVDGSRNQLENDVKSLHSLGQQEPA